MKKIFTFCLAVCLGLSVSAQELSKGQLYRQKLVQQQDDLLNLLLQTPFELRQYIFPLLNEKASVPKKIKTHPEVIIWKGKKPTRVAKKFQNDAELLEYLPAQYYYYLAPDMWPDEIVGNQNFEANPNRLFLNFAKSSVDSDGFNAEELITFKNAIRLLNQSLTENQRNVLEQKNQPIYLETLIVFPSAELEKKLQPIGYTSMKELAKKIDKVALIYRQIKKGHFPKDQGKEAAFVKEYFSLIPILFKNTSFEVLLNEKLYAD